MLFLQLKILYPIRLYFISLTIGQQFLSYFIKTQVLNQFEVAILVLILGVNGALEFFTLASTMLLSADQRTYVISLASLAHIIINTLIVVILGSMQVNIVVLRL